MSSYWYKSMNKLMNKEKHLIKLEKYYLVTIIIIINSAKKINGDKVFKEQDIYIALIYLLSKLLFQ